MSAASTEKTMRRVVTLAQQTVAQQTVAQQTVAQQTVAQQTVADSTAPVAFAARSIGVENVDPADVVVVPLRCDAAVEWLVLDATDDAVHLVPADTAPSLGVHDVAMADGVTSGFGPFVVRCGWARWYTRAALDAAHRSGTVPAAFLDQVRTRSRATESAGERLMATESQEEGDDLGWIEEAVRPAVQELGERFGIGAGAGDADKGAAEAARGSGAAWSRPTSQPPPPSRLLATGWRPSGLALAAAVLLALNGVLLVWGWSAHQRVPEDSKVAVDAHYAFLHPVASLRGEVPALRLGSNDQTVLLVAIDHAHRAGRPVTLSLVRMAAPTPTEDALAEKVLWQGSSTVSAEGEITLALDATLLMEGRYQLRKSRPDRGEEAGAAYLFDVVRDP